MSATYPMSESNQPTICRRTANSSTRVSLNHLRISPKIVSSESPDQGS
jgi:hypothetical protein